MPRNRNYKAYYHSNNLQFSNLGTEMRQFSAYLGACF